MNKMVKIIFGFTLLVFIFGNNQSALASPAVIIKPTISTIEHQSI